MPFTGYWRFTLSYDGWSFADITDDYTLNPCGACSATRSHVTGAIRTELIVASLPNVSAAGKHTSPTSLNAEITSGDTIDVDYGATSDAQNTAVELYAYYTDETVESTSAASATAGTLTLTLTQTGKFLERIEIILARSTGGSAIGSTSTRDLLEVRITTTIQWASSQNDFRFIGFGTDGVNLHVAGLKNAGTLTVYDYDLPTLGENGTTYFGDATDSEVDARTRGIFPVWWPTKGNVLFLYGRDGNNVQVQYNDRNGTLGWTDVGAGTATWGTDKYAVALMVDPISPDDVVVVFSDNDVYRSRYGTATWTKTGDASSGLRAAARLIADQSNKILVGGTVAGTVEFSHNFGVSFADISGTAVGVIYALEVSL